ncbi:MAG TPA: transcription termination factor Rho [Acidimicrobiales bacterium]|nr:transcription termination factor Rho [Acidimicrobiales bacterium]
MAAEQQLERSVLERKEREELRAIAEAMALDTNSRSKKADIIDQILRAAGVDAKGTAGPAAGSENANGAAPARPRSRASSARAATNVDAELAPGETATNGDSAEHAHSNGTAQAANSDNGHADTAEESASAGTARSGADASDEVSGGPDGAVAAPAERSAPGRQGPGQNNPGQNRQQTQQGQQGQHSQAGNPNDPANRRGRRRRGRERTGPGGGPGGGGGGERELQGGGQEAQYQGELVAVSGLLDLRDEGYGFVRAEGYLPSPRDVYVSISQARRFALRKGDYVEGASRPAASNEKFPALIRIDTVSGLSPDDARNRPRFEDLTPLFPDSKLKLETPGAAEITTRIIDLLSPIGKGQRGMIVSPPKAGKTTVMKQIAHSIEANNPEVHLIVLLVDERPEEVTDMRRSVKGEVVASTFDRPSDEHTAIAELTIDHAKRLVEVGRDVVIILDGITRLARAYNLAQPASGRIMSGGVDSGALYPPKRFFGAARNIEEGGSLTILATALVETGSKMDEVIFEEFKGTGNMELRLDRRLAERRLYPSIDVNASSTRHEELLFERGQLQQVWKLRRVLNALAADGNAAAGLELLMDKIRTTKSNDEFLAEIAKGPAT